jgi:hypothetical protein
MSKSIRNGKLIADLIEGERIQLPFGVPITVKRVVPGDACYIEGYIDGDSRLTRIFVVSLDFFVQVLRKEK